MKDTSEKTNVMRVLEQKKIPYIPHGYPHDEGAAVDAKTVAALLGRPPEQIYKTLVARGGKGGLFVFVIPATAELDLKKAAKASGEKSVELLKVSELLPLTGYIRGGCSPIGMKKALPTVFDSAVLNLETVIVSAGKIGRQVELAPPALLGLIRASTADISIQSSAD